jgi:crotonobetainyl-CoA:carnitine CoA-transferase CaiB-like acyl-CoA transferase
VAPKSAAVRATYATDCFDCAVNREAWGRLSTRSIRSPENQMPGPLEGIRIIDISAMLSGPWATDILGDQGADVIKVEEPGTGDHTRRLRNQSAGLPAAFLNINRSKRSISLNLKTEAGLRILRDLAAGADVLVQNFRPGVVERLGIGYEDLSKVNSRLVYLSISGFGEKGPWAQRRVYDPIVQALSGLTTIQVGADDRRPHLVRTILPDKLTAVTAAQAVTAALVARARTGQGQHVRLSLLDAVLAFLWVSDMNGQTFVDRPVEPQKAASFIDLIYETRDGYMTVAVMGDKEWNGLCHALAHAEWLDDARFKTPASRDEHVNERLELIQAALHHKTTEEWLAIFAEHDVPCAPALTRKQVIEHPQVLASEVLIETEHPVAGRLRQTRTAARFEGTPPGRPRGAPRLGEHNAEVLRELGYDAARIEMLRKEGVIGAERYEEAEPKSVAAST